MAPRPNISGNSIFNPLPRSTPRLRCTPLHPQIAPFIEGLILPEHVSGVQAWGQEGVRQPTYLVRGLASTHYVPHTLQIYLNTLDLQVIHTQTLQIYPNMHLADNLAFICHDISYDICISSYPNIYLNLAFTHVLIYIQACCISSSHHSLTSCQSSKHVTTWQ